MPAAFFRSFQTPGCAVDAAGRYTYRDPETGAVHGLHWLFGWLYLWTPLLLLVTALVLLVVLWPLLLALVVASPALAQEEAPPSPEAAAQAEVARGPQPFGANLFSGNYAAERENGLNPDYRILPGDRVMVNAWGAVTINDVFAVDTQGNIFLPGIGPIQLEGVASDQLTPTVEAAIRRVYRGTFGVYTNLLNASPVAVFVTGGVERPGPLALGEPLGHRRGHRPDHRGLQHRDGARDAARAIASPCTCRAGRAPGGCCRHPLAARAGAGKGRGARVQLPARSGWRR